MIIVTCQYIKIHLNYPKSLTEVLNFNKNVLFRKPAFIGLLKRPSNAPTKTVSKCTDI